MTTRLFKIVFVSFLLLPKGSFSQKVDTILIRDLKDFFYKETHYVLKGDFFTKWDYSDDFRLFVSPSDRIDDYEENKEYTETIDYDTLKYDPSYDTLYYDVPADAGCKLRPEFNKYSNEGLAFIIFHELMHNFIRQKQIKIPYVFEEAISDIMGNYCTLDFAKSDHRIKIKSAQKQILTNDSLYVTINRCISAIDDHPEMIAIEHSRCEERLRQLLEKANEFQKFRFGYKVNNGFLLKCRNYSWNYFLFEKIFLEQHSIFDFVQVIYQLSGDCTIRSDNAEKYRLELYANTNWSLDVTFVWDSLFPIMADRNAFYFTVTDKDPLNRFVYELSLNCTEDEITPDSCLFYWNEVVKSTGHRSNINIKNFNFTGSDHFGKNWLVTSAFVSDNQIICWMEEINLQIGKKTRLVLTKDNATFITTKNKNK
jgi:hypothetical protein